MVDSGVRNHTPISMILNPPSYVPIAEVITGTRIPLPAL
jgi:hypothetical protein